MVEGGDPACRFPSGVVTRPRGGPRQREGASLRWPWPPRDAGMPVRRVMRLSRARGRADRSGGLPGRHSRGRGAARRACPPVWGVGGARGRERAGPTRSHPEPGRDPAQRRRVLWGRPHGRRGRRGHPPPPAGDGQTSREAGGGQTTKLSQELIADSRAQPRLNSARRGVEQRQLVGLITQRSGVRIPPPLPDETRYSESDRALLLGRFFVVLTETSSR